MSTRINHNVLALTAQRHISNTQKSLDTALTRLSSGLRINYAWDDPGGLAVSERFRAQIASLEEAERNTNYNINLMATAEGALQVIDEKLVRIGKRVASQLDGFAEAVNDSIDGLIKLAKDRYRDQIESIERQIEAYERRLVKKRDMLTRQFLAMEEAVSQAQSQAGWTQSLG